MLLFILIGLWLNPTSANPPVVLTVCEAFYAGSLYEGRNVYIVGRLASTNEGSWISHGHCACAIDGYAGYTKLEIAPLYDPNLREPDFEDAGPAIAEKLRARRTSSELVIAGWSHSVGSTAPSSVNPNQDSDISRRLVERSSVPSW